MSEAGAPLPFCDAGLEGRVRQSLDLQARGIRRFRGDGRVFNNRESLLPARPKDYYREYTVAPELASQGRGRGRLVAGQSGEVYYTPDHYNSFTRLR